MTADTPDRSKNMDRARAAFNTVPVHRALGMQLDDIGTGEARLSMPIADAVRQQHGFFHAGALTALADSAAGTAAFTLLEDSETVLSTNISISLMRPVSAERIRAVGRVIKAGRRMLYCEAEIAAETDPDNILVKASVTLIREVMK